MQSNSPQTGHDARGRHTAARDEQRGYGPNPRSEPYRERHAHRGGDADETGWPASDAPIQSEPQDDSYARRHYGDEARPERDHGQTARAPSAEGFYRFGSMRRRTPLGPKGYVRSDERIREDVCDRLSMRADLDVADVSVDVKEGCVALEGTVPERRMKHAIEDVCDACPGVREIENRIRVSQAPADGPHH